MEINFKEIAGAFVVLFAILDIIGSIPIIIDLQHKTGKVPAFKVSLISWVLLTSIYFLGDGILSLFGVDIHSFAIAGSIVIPPRNVNHSSVGVPTYCRSRIFYNFTIIKS